MEPKYGSVVQDWRCNLALRSISVCLILLVCGCTRFWLPGVEPYSVRFSVKPDEPLSFEFSPRLFEETTNILLSFSGNCDQYESSFKTADDFGGIVHVLVTNSKNEKIIDQEVRGSAALYMDSRHCSILLAELQGFSQHWSSKPYTCTIRFRGSREYQRRHGIVFEEVVIQTAGNS